MGMGKPLEGSDRVVERRRAVALARHFREAEGLWIAQIAQRLGRSAATVKAYFLSRPHGAKARAVKARYVGECRGCGAYTQPRNGKGRRLRLLQAVPPGRDRAALDSGAGAGGHGEWLDPYGRVASSHDWSVTQARRRGGEALARLQAGGWPAASVVTNVFGTWGAARAAGGESVLDERSFGPRAHPRARAASLERAAV
jgi:hypothetical protein